MSNRLSTGERREFVQLIEGEREMKLAELNASDFGWRSRLDARLRKRAIGILKVDREATEVQKIEAMIERLEKQKSELEAAITAKMPRNKSSRGGCGTPISLCEAIEQITSEINLAEMKKDPAGKKVLAMAETCRIKLAKLALCVTREDVGTAKIV